jgi:hypothetical protein
MIWSIEIGDGFFDGNHLKKIIKEIVNHYADNNENACAIKSITVYYENSKQREICQRGINKVQNEIEKNLEEFKKTSQEELENQREIESNYWGAIL